MKQRDFDYPQVGVAFCICKGNHVLLHKRKGNHAGGTWAFAGGHLEKGETFEECCIREGLEEFGGDLKYTEPLFLTALNTIYTDENRHYVTIIMVANWIDGEPILMEPDKCEEWKWFDWNDLPQPLMQGLQYMKDNNIVPTKQGRDVISAELIEDIWYITLECGHKTTRTILGCDVYGQPRDIAPKRLRCDECTNNGKTN